MACRTDYMEPNAKERHRREAAIIALMVSEVVLLRHPSCTQEYANDLYGGDDDTVVKWLCGVFQLNENLILTNLAHRYGTYGAETLRAVSWWHEHKKIDAERTAKEEEEKLLEEARDFIEEAPYIVLDKNRNLYGPFDSFEAAKNAATNYDGYVTCMDFVD